MADPPPFPDAGEEIGTPRWVKVSAIIGAAVVLLVVVMLLAGHGPGQHFPGGNTPPAGVTEHGMQQP